MAIRSLLAGACSNYNLNEVRCQVSSARRQRVKCHALSAKYRVTPDTWHLTLVLAFDARLERLNRAAQSFVNRHFRFPL
jgi:hypothetical protein